jgi:hypothetical protein
VIVLGWMLLEHNFTLEHVPCDPIPAPSSNSAHLPHRFVKFLVQWAAASAAGQRLTYVAWNGGQGGAKFEKFDQVCVRGLVCVCNNSRLSRSKNSLLL